MKIAIYSILGLIGLLLLLVAGFLFWFFSVYKHVPALEIPADATPSEAAAVIDEYLIDLNRSKKFNGYVMISKAGEPLLAKAYGYSEATLSQPLTTDSSLRLASVSKQFTAAAILVLLEKEQLSLDYEVQTYIGGFPYEGVTIRHLLNQTSGIPDAYMSLAKSHKDKIKILTPEKVVDLLIEADLPANAPPNAQYAYCNTSYVLLAYLIETISGQSFEAFLTDELFTPLDMQNTRVWNLLSSEPSFPNKAEGMDIFFDASPVTETFLDGVAGDGAVFSSANDFIIWDQFWNGNSLVSDDHLTEAFRKPVMNDGSESDYGFGWVVRDYGSFHNGQWLAANSIYLRNTKTQTAFVLVDNSSNVNFPKIGLNIGTYYARQH